MINEILWKEQLTHGQSILEEKNALISQSAVSVHRSSVRLVMTSTKKNIASENSIHIPINFLS